MVRNNKNLLPSELTKDEKILQVLNAAEEKEKTRLSSQVPRVPAPYSERPRPTSISNPPKGFDAERMKSSRKSSLPNPPIYVTPRAIRGDPLRRRALASWTIEHVCSFLREMGLGVYQRVFEENELDGQSLSLLSRADLESLIPHPAHRQRFIDALVKHGISL